MLSAPLFVVGAALVSGVKGTPNGGVFFLGVLLFSLALPGMYALHARAAGWLGLVGHVLLATGITYPLIFGGGSILIHGFTGLGESAPAFLLGIMISVGFVLTGLAMLRARVYPLWLGILWLVAGAGFFFGFIVAELVPPLVGMVGHAVVALCYLGAWEWTGVTLLRAKVAA
jgi:hypothetical protein